MHGNRPSGSEPSSVYKSVWHNALATTLRRTSPGRGGATLTLAIRTSSTPKATAASHSIVSPVPEAEKLMGRRNAPAPPFDGATHDAAPEGGAQHAQPEPCSAEDANVRRLAAKANAAQEGERSGVRVRARMRDLHSGFTGTCLCCLVCFRRFLRVALYM